MQGEKRFIKVTEKEYEWLMKGWKTGKKSAFRQRCHYIILSHQGKTIQEITEIYQVTRQTVSTWFGKYEIAGISGLHSNKKTGRPAIIRVDNETEVIEIEKLVENSSQNLKPVLTEGWCWKRFRKECPQKPDPEEYQEKCKVLDQLTLLFLLGYIDLRFSDETAFTLQPNVPYGWIRKGEQRGIPSRKGGNLNIFGLLNLQGQLTTYQTTKSVNSEQIIEWLDEYASTIKKWTVVVLDNAPWHISKSIENKLFRY